LAGGQELSGGAPRADESEEGSCPSGASQSWRAPPTGKGIAAGWCRAPVPARCSAVALRQSALAANPLFLGPASGIRSIRNSDARGGLPRRRYQRVGCLVFNQPPGSWPQKKIATWREPARSVHGQCARNTPPLGAGGRQSCIFRVASASSGRPSCRSWPPPSIAPTNGHDVETTEMLSHTDLGSSGLPVEEVVYTRQSARWGCTVTFWQYQQPGGIRRKAFATCGRLQYRKT